jgi:hypothetical protein
MIRKLALALLLTGLTAVTQNSACAGLRNNDRADEVRGQRTNRHHPNRGGDKAGSITANAPLAADTTPGSDNANDPAYAAPIWANGSDGGTAATFQPWNLTGNNNNGTTAFAGYFIGDSTAGSGDINTSGKSFGVFANPSAAFATADRSFDSALGVGQTFSLDIAVNFLNGNKGFNLYTGGTAGQQIFNFNAGGNAYGINNEDTGLLYSATSVFHLAFTQDSLAGGSYSVSRSASTFTGSYTGDADAFRLYNSGTVDGGAANNLYANNLNVSTAAVPEPATVLLVGPAILGGIFFTRRRRS